METRFLRHLGSLLRPRISHPSSGLCSSAKNSGIAGKRNPTYQINHRKASNQAKPVGGFYESILEDSLEPPASDPAASKLKSDLAHSEQSKKTSSEAQKEEIASKARVVFGSRLAGPAERRQTKDRQSQVIAGVRVPPKPVEPDNCCMSGCVNCVWDVYRDDVEEWATMKKKADRALAAELRRGGTGIMLGEGKKNATHTMVSMDDDGGGSETNWGNAELGTDANEEIFEGIPVGIREFMKQEKRLKEKHMREGSIGG